MRIDTKFISIAFAKAIYVPAVCAAVLVAANMTSAADISRDFARDAKRDAQTKAHSNPKDKFVYRYTSKEQAKKETVRGIAPGTHMSSNAPAGRTLSKQGAKERFGLKTIPDVREKILLKKGSSIKTNKTISGKAGVGETVAASRIGKDKIVDVKRLRDRRK